MRLDERRREIADLRRLLGRATGPALLVGVERLDELRYQLVVHLVALVLETTEDWKPRAACARARMGLPLLRLLREPLHNPRLDLLDGLHLLVRHEAAVDVKLAPVVKREPAERGRVDDIPLAAARRDFRDPLLPQLRGVLRLALRRALLYGDRLDRERKYLGDRLRIDFKNDAFAGPDGRGKSGNQRQSRQFYAGKTESRPLRHSRCSHAVKSIKFHSTVSTRRTRAQVKHKDLNAAAGFGPPRRG